MKIIGILVIAIFPIVTASFSIADSLTLDDLARKPDGSVNRMTQADAVNYCKTLGGHLPTARELAYLLNPNGILEVPQYDNLNFPQRRNYWIVDTASGDKFYNNSSAYTTPQGDLGSDPIWSSSGFKNSNEDAYAFFEGSFNPFNRVNLSFAVRCAREQ